MKEKTLLKTALVCSIIGVTVLFFVSEFIEVSESELKDITIDDLDRYVKVIGTVSKVVNTEKVIIMDIVQPHELKVVVFKDKDISLNKGDYIEVLGKVEEYEGELEIIGDRIRIIE
jgi:DNA/RNA endonuclease YhcR with UshA esterase domain